MSGFQHAPVTRGMMMATTIGSIIASLTNTKPYLHLQIDPHITVHRQLWRFVCYTMAFTNSAELVVALMTFYHMAIPLERAWGSNKYTSFVLLTTMLSSITTIVSLLVLHSLFGANYVPAGPFALMGGITYQYWRLIPTIYNFKIWGITYSSKIILTLFPVFLVALQFPSSGLPFMAGVIISMTYLHPLLVTRRIPSPLARLASRLSVESTPPRRSDRVIPDELTPGMRAARQAQANASALGELLAVRAALSTATGTAATPNLPRATTRQRNTAGTAATSRLDGLLNTVAGSDAANAPSEDNIQSILSMFPNLTRQRVVEVLQQSNNNTALAIEGLLTTET